MIIRDPPPRRRVAGEEQLIYEGRNFQTANGHALVALGILAQEILREEISQEKGLTLTPAQAQLGPQWTDVVDPNGTTHPSKIIPEKRKRTSKGARQEDNESDASAEGPSVEETRSTLSVNDAVSDESDVF